MGWNVWIYTGTTSSLQDAIIRQTNPTGWIIWWQEMATMDPQWSKLERDIYSKEDIGTTTI